MHAFTYSALGLLTLGATLACSSGTTTAGSVSPSRTADETTIRALDDSIVAAMQARDAAAVSAYYATDAQLLPPNRRSAVGPQAIRAAWTEDFSLPNIDLTFAPQHIEVSASGDMAADIGTYQVTLDGPEGVVGDTGKYVVVWRKVDGAWKIAADMWNSDLALPEPPKPPPAVATVGDPAEMEVVSSSHLRWTPLELPGFKPGIQMVVIHGDPSSTGDYTLRLRFPAGYDFPSHWHPKGEHLTVIRGTFRVGMGAREDAKAVKSYRPGDFLYIPAEMPHFGGATGITEVQLHGEGPFAVELSSQSSLRQ